MIEKTFDVDLWSPSEYQIARMYSGEEAPHVLGKGDSMAECGWIKIGTGTLTAQLIDPKDTVAEQVKSLEAQIQKAEADAQLTITRLRGQINNLLAICHDSGE
jgi:hypothetical protein